MTNAVDIREYAYSDPMVNSIKPELLELSDKKAVIYHPIYPILYTKKFLDIFVLTSDRGADDLKFTFLEYEVTDDKSKVNIDTVHKLLSTSYWAADRSKEIVLTTIENSICFSVLHTDKQVGFARVVTDYAVFAWIADVIIHPDHRGKGLGKFLMQCIECHPDIPSSLQMLRTRDGHGLYEKFGFSHSDVMCK